MNRGFLLLVLGVIVTGALVYVLVLPGWPSLLARKPAAAPDASVAVTGESPRPVQSPRSRQPPHTGAPAPPATGTDAALPTPGTTPSPESPPSLEPVIRKALGEILDTSSAGLVEQTRDGITGVDLQRRFRTAPVATLDEHGEVQITDYSSLPGEPAAP